jgi:hypothetical protein
VLLGGRAARKEKEQEIAREIKSRTENRQERQRLRSELTGKSEAALYRRLAELSDG